MALVSSMVVSLMLVLGFLELGPPRSQRAIRADSQRVQQLYQLGMAVQNYWRAHASQLPPSLDNLPGAHVDPLTSARYEYRPGQGNQFELCATFARSNNNGETRPNPEPSFWTHPAGHYCFPLDASTQLQYPTEYLPN